MALPALFLLLAASSVAVAQAPLALNDRGYFSARGLDVFVYHNTYAGLFSDEKKAGIELIQHGRRIATNGDVRLSNTPEQWDPAPRLDNRTVDGGRVRVLLSYPDHDFSYRVEVQPQGESLLITVQLERALPKALEGRAGFNLEFLPAVYFGKTWMLDERGGVLPQHPHGPLYREMTGVFEAAPLATGNTLVLAPESDERRVTIESVGGKLGLYDGRNKAQNGWFVVRELLPAGKTGTVLQWRVTPNRIPNWTRTPVIAHSQLGYHPAQNKIAVLELDPNFTGPTTATLVRVNTDGTRVPVLTKAVDSSGSYLRYHYARFDFSTVRAPGLYLIEFAGVTSAPFRIDRDVYRGNVWQSSLDTFLPVQMDHMFVNDRYRVWHGASHLDDARQAPVDSVHFDLYAQGRTTDTRFRPGEHIPGLNVGGWYDAGDFDIRTQSQYAVVSGLVFAHETFGIDWDQTTVDQAKRYVDIGVPDGVPDIIQQIEHGTLWLLAQYRAVGHAINGVVEPTLAQYTHLGDAVTKTDNQPGTQDDRLAFTSRATALDYGSIAALAAASRVLRGHNDALAGESLETAKRVWVEEHSRPPATFRHGNTTGGRLEDEELKAAVELLITTRGDRLYAERLRAMLPHIEQNFEISALPATRALPFMDAGFRARIEAMTRTYKTRLDEQVAANPFGVPITTGGWGGSGAVAGFGLRNYVLHRAFPGIIGPEHTLRAFEYLLGTHPSSSVSLVSGIGAHSKTNAYGANRADYSFIPGGIVPGIVIVGPDLPELMEDWPFLWYESEYVIPLAASFIYLSHAVADLTSRVQTWSADNGNGTFSNPLFYDEFSDPDLIRVGDDFYLTGTTMHAMPGLPVLHSRDLINWELMSYALDRLDLEPRYRLEGGEIYGQGIWAPTFRYHNGTFHIFANVNGQTTQHFTATNPRGPWTRTAMKRSLHDLSVLFDDDGKAYVVWGYQEMRFAQLDNTLTDIVPGTERVLFAKDAGMGEGAHFYKINGKYFIISAWYAGRMRLPAARADRPEGPYEVNQEISADEVFGLRQGYRLRGNGRGPEIVMTPGNPTARGTMSMHQGGIVHTPAGEWWGFSMMDANSVGRLTALSPITWKDGWPYFGLPGNLGRTPRIWVKPKTAQPSAPRAPYIRNDEFSGPQLANVWQWNHVPDDTRWSLTERAGHLRLHALPAADFWTARNTLTQRAVGPQSSATTLLDAAGMLNNDVAGLALLNRPYAWVGVRRTDSGLLLQQYDQLADTTASMPLTGTRVWLRADCDFLTEQARFSYSTDGATWTPFGRPFTMAFQLKTFQGVRFALFHYNTGGAPGGVADFDLMHVDEPHPRGLIRPIPLSQTITLQAAGRETPFVLAGEDHFTVEDRGLGRVALRAGSLYISVTAQSDSTSRVVLRAQQPGDGETFQWMETLYGDLVLMSLATHRYLRLEPDGRLSSDSAGPEPDPNDGTALRWRIAGAPATLGAHEF